MGFNSAFKGLNKHEFIMHPVSAQELKRKIRCDLSEQSTTATLQVCSLFIIKYFPCFM